MMAQEIVAMRAECNSLETLLRGLAPDRWRTATSFYDWTIADQVMHLHQVDQFGVIALSGPAGFPDVVADVRAWQESGIELSRRMRQDWGDLDPGALLDLWAQGWRTLAAMIEGSDPATRIPWFGPDMAVLSFAAARQMEVWAHGQDIYDVLSIRRTANDYVLNICDLGVRTQGWSFRNRGLVRPLPPQVTLTAPSGQVRTWNDGAVEQISGLAEDFALVVTQRRHVDDTALVTGGAGARAWMEIAQCFAGAAAQGPVVGVRRVNWTA